MSKEVTGGMGADDARLAVVEQRVDDQDRQIREVVQRLNRVESEQSAQRATQQAMQESVGKIERNTDAANNKLDALKMWMLGAAVSFGVATILLLVQWAAK